jgi:putative oxidoreductase
MDDSAVTVGLVLIRLELGLMVVTHGVNKVFGVGGVSGTASWFEELGLRPSLLHAWVAAATEVGTGALMCVGLLFPAACAGFVGLMTVAGLIAHRGKGFFVFRGGWEYVVFVAAVATGLAFIGPGRWSLDQLIGTELHGFAWGAAVLFVGLIAGLGTVAVFHRPALKEQSA